MSFVRFGHHRSQKYGGSVRVGLSISKGKSPAIGIGVGPIVVDLKRWRVGTKLELMWGADADFGRIALRESPSGLRLTLSKTDAASYSLRFRTIPSRPMRDKAGVLWALQLVVRRSVICPHFDLPDGSLGIQLPVDWFEQAGEIKASWAWGRYEGARKSA